MTRVVYARCPVCKGADFRFFDKNPGGDYPNCRFECIECGRVWGQFQLKGITYPEVPF